MDGLPRPYWYLWAGALVDRLGTFVLPFLVLYLTGPRRFSVEQAGDVVALLGAGALGAGPLGGFLADRLGRRTALVGGMVVSAASMLHLGLARSPAHIAVAAFVLGLLGGCYRPALNATIADLVPSPERPRAYGLLYWAINLGTAAALILAGLLARHGYILLFVGDAATTLACATIVARGVRETRPLGPSGGRAERPSFFAPYGDGILLGLIAVSLLVALVFQQGMTALPLDMRAHGLSARTYGFIMAANCVLVVLLQPSASELAQRFRLSHVLAAGALLIGGGFAIAALAPARGGEPAYAASVVVWTLGEIVVMPLAVTVVADLAPADLRAGYQGAYQIVWGAAGIVAPALGTFVLGHAGGRALWCACLVAGCVAAAGHLLIAGPRQRRLAALRAQERTGEPVAERDVSG